MKSKVLKRLIILVLAVVMVVGGAVNVYAADVEDGGVYLYADVNEKIAELGIIDFPYYDSSKKYVLFRAPNNGSSTVIYLVSFSASDNTYAYITNEGNNERIEFVNADSLEVYYIRPWTTISSYNVWALQSVYSGGTYAPVYDINTTTDYYYSDINIYSDSEKTSFFFQSTLLPTPLVLGMEAENLTQMILPTMNPVVGLISLVVCSVVLLIGLRKGLSLLWTALHKA